MSVNAALLLQEFIFTLKGLRDRRVDRPVLQNTDLWHNIIIPPF